MAHEIVVEFGEFMKFLKTPAGSALKPYWEDWPFWVTDMSSSGMRVKPRHDSNKAKFTSLRERFINIFIELLRDNPSAKYSDIQPSVIKQITEDSGFPASYEIPSKTQQNWAVDARKEAINKGIVVASRPGVSKGSKPISRKKS